VADALLGSLDLLTNACSILRRHCVAGLEANEERCRRTVHDAQAALTALVEPLGYHVASEVAQAAQAEGRSVREIVLSRGLMTAEAFDQWVSPERVMRLGFPPKKDAR